MIELHFNFAYHEMDSAPELDEPCLVESWPEAKAQIEAWAASSAGFPILWEMLVVRRPGFPDTVKQCAPSEGVPPAFLKIIRKHALRAERVTFLMGTQPGGNDANGVPLGRDEVCITVVT